MKVASFDFVIRVILSMILFVLGSVYGAWECEKKAKAKETPFSYTPAEKAPKERYPVPVERAMTPEEKELRSKQVDWTDARGYHSPEAMEWAIAFDIYMSDKSSSLDYKTRTKWSLERAKEFMAAAGYPQEAEDENKDKEVKTGEVGR